MGTYVFVSLKSIHKGYITVTYKHNERLKGYRNRNYIDSSRSDQNYHLIEPQGPYMEEIKRKIEEAKAVPRTQSILLVEGRIGPSAEWIKAKNLDDQKKFFEYSLSFFTERIGAKNFVSAVVHMDEASPHMHFTFVPITQEGRVSVNAVMGGRLRDGAEPNAIRRFREAFPGQKRKDLLCRDICIKARRSSTRVTTICTMLSRILISLTIRRKKNM